MNKLNEKQLANIEKSAVEFIVSSVKKVHQMHPKEHIYGAIFHCFYADGENISQKLEEEGLLTDLLKGKRHPHFNLDFSLLVTYAISFVQVLPVFLPLLVCGVLLLIAVPLLAWLGFLG